MFGGIETILGVCVGIPLGLAWVSHAMFRWILNPLAIPPRFKLLAKRERTLAFVTFIALNLLFVGALVLLVVYAIGLYKHFQSQARIAKGTEEPEPCPIIPRFSISDMLAMVFSIGFVPVLYQLMTEAIQGQEWIQRHAAEQPQVGVVFLGIALFTFPACFLSTLYRLDINKVPPSLPRSILLALSPYLVISCWTTIPIFIVTLFIFSERHPSFPEILFFLGGAIAMIVIGRHTANVARDQIGKMAGV